MSDNYSAAFSINLDSRSIKKNFNALKKDLEKNPITLKLGIDTLHAESEINYLNQQITSAISSSLPIFRAIHQELLAELSITKSIIKNTNATTKLSQLSAETAELEKQLQLLSDYKTIYNQIACNSSSANTLSSATPAKVTSNSSGNAWTAVLSELFKGITNDIKSDLQKKIKESLTTGSSGRSKSGSHKLFSNARYGQVRMVNVM